MFTVRSTKCVQQYGNQAVHLLERKFLEGSSLRLYPSFVVPRAWPPSPSNATGSVGIPSLLYPRVLGLCPASDLWLVSFVIWTKGIRDQIKHKSRSEKALAAILGTDTMSTIKNPLMKMRNNSSVWEQIWKWGRTVCWALSLNMDFGRVMGCI